MICLNCGGEFSDELLRCPYCGTENTDAVNKVKNSAYEELDKEKEKIKNIPETVKKKSGIYARKIMVLSIVGVLAVVFGIVLITRFTMHVGDKQKDNAIEKLEKMYSQGNYDDMSEYISKSSIQSYQSRYDKYTQIADISDTYNKVDSYIDEINKIMTDNTSEQAKKDIIPGYIQWIIEDAFEQIKETQEAVDDRAPLGNEDVLLEYIGKLKNILFNQLKITQEEYNTLYECEKYTDENLAVISETLMERLVK